MSFTYNDRTDLIGAPELLVVKWSSGASANPSEASKPLPPGFVTEFITVPSGSPDDNYDLTLIDAAGSDVLRGSGADRDTANTERAVVRDNGVGYPSPYMGGTLTPTVTNQTNAAASITAYFFIKIPNSSRK